MTQDIQKLGRLRKRAEFLFVAEKGDNKGKYAAKPGIVIQMRQHDNRTDGIHVGFTATKKVGNAVVRNKAKRRLRECARMHLPARGLAGHDYVFIARAETAKMDWNELQQNVEKALLRLK